jgi:hypothetical protein
MTTIDTKPSAPLPTRPEKALTLEVSSGGLSRLSATGPTRGPRRG